MRIWLITIGEPLPTDAGSPRLLRAGLLSSYLVQAGHEVVFWSSTMDHQSKQLRAHAFTEKRCADGSHMLLLHGQPYHRNISFARVRNQRQLAQQFRRRVPGFPPPDIILCSYPTIELCEEAVTYGRARQIPVVIDIRDLWPDVFLDLAPPWLRGFARMMLAPAFRQSARVCSGATAIFGITDPFRDWAIARAGRERNALDHTFPMAYSARAPEPTEAAAVCLSWDQWGVTAGRPIACFFGTFGRQFDLDTVIDAAAIARKTDPDLLWVLCGDGERLQHYRDKAQGVNNVVLPGWVDRIAIYTLMQRSSIGLAPYWNTPNFVNNLPNKPIEYLSAGLPVVATIGGVIREKIVDRNAGISVQPQNPRALAAAVSGLINDSERHASMVTSARKLFREEYMAEVVYDKMIRHLERIAKEARSD